MLCRGDGERFSYIRPVESCWTKRGDHLLESWLDIQHPFLRWPMIQLVQGLDPVFHGFGDRERDLVMMFGMTLWKQTFRAGSFCL